MLAAELGHKDMALLLLRAGANVNSHERASAFYHRRRTALYLACENGNLEMVELLLKWGAHPDCMTQLHFYPLYIAIALGYNAVARCLLEHGADPNGPKNGREPPIVAAARENNLSVLRELLGRGARVEDEALAEACSSECAREILQRGINVNKKDSNGKTPLLRSINLGNKELIECYLQAGADVNVKDCEEMTALMLLRDNPKLNIAKLLVTAGANVNELTTQGVTVLDSVMADTSRAKRAARRRFIEYLREEGARTGAEIKESNKATKSRRVRPQGLVAGSINKGEKAVTGLSQTTMAPNPVNSPAPPQQPLSPDLNREAFERLARNVAEWCKHPSAPFEANGLCGVTFAVAEQEVEQIIQALLDECRRAGAYLFECESGRRLALLPTPDPWKVLAAVGTSAPNHELDTPRIIEWLKRLNTKTPFLLTAAGPDFVGGRLLEPISNCRSLAKSIHAFCPDTVDQGTGTVASLALSLKKTHRFFLWWD